MTPEIAELERVLATVDDRASIAQYLQASRALDRFGASLQPARLALLASFTVDPLVPYLRVEAARHRLDAQIYIGPFNSVSQELLSAVSGCVAHAPDVVFVCQMLEDVCPALLLDFLSLDDADVEHLISTLVGDIAAATATFRRASSAAVVVQNFAQPPHALLGIAEPMASRSQADAIRRVNLKLVEALRTVAGVYVLDVDRLIGEIGQRHWYNEKMWLLARAPLSAEALRGLARTQLAYVRALRGHTRKCLVVDLDNTVWGGIVGESGVSGIALGSTYPGNAFLAFQQYLLQLYRRGVLLAICSKNNRGDVEDAFRTHPDMVLRLEHFAAIRINWQDKSVNVREIAAELNIGLDSMAFFDDSPAECARMRAAVPEVMTIQAPPDVVRYSQALIESGAFEQLSLSDDDRRRGEMYQAQRERNTLSSASTSLEEFLEALDMSIEIRPVDDFTFPRVAALVQKTNQFNLTTRRHSAAQLRNFVDDPDCGVFSLQLTDRFGDNGTVGAAIVTCLGEHALIDTLLLSCRVIGRNAETAFLSYVAEWARARGCGVLEGEFIATSKNAPAADFFKRHGFTEVTWSSGSSRWRANLKEVPFRWPTYIRTSEVAKV